MRRWLHIGHICEIPEPGCLIWRTLGLEDHARQVYLYFQRAGYSSVTVHVLRDGCTAIR